MADETKSNEVKAVVEAVAPVKADVEKAQEGRRYQRTSATAMEEGASTRRRFTSEHDTGVDPEQVDLLAAAEDCRETGP